jgi:ligand-binding sensor domain-containing protein/signal transduction histidine kinase
MKPSIDACKIPLLVLGLVLLSFPAVSAPDELPGIVIRSWSAESGLPHNSVKALAQTRDGYIWLGTREGLARFDGVRFTTFGLADGLQSVDIEALCEDRAGTLWIGTRGGGLSRRVNGSIETMSALEGSVSSDIISALTEDAVGRLWVGTRGGLRIWDGHRFVRDEALADLARSPINALLRDHSGNMWIATARQGLFEFHKGQLTERAGPPSDERILAYCLLEDQKGGVWASVGNGKLLRFTDGAWTTLDETNGLPFAYITSMAEEPDGTIWAGSLDDGLFRFHNGFFQPVRESNGLSGNDISALLADREGNLWVGTRTAGVNCISRRKLITYGPAEGLTNDFTRSVAETADGRLWVGTYGGGLNVGGASGFQPSPSEQPGHRYAFVDSALAAPDGSIWYGARRGLFHLRDDTVVDAITNEPWLNSASVTALCNDPRGGLWIGTSESRLIHGQGGVFKEMPRAVARGAIVALAPEADKYLWVGSEAGGLKRINLSDFSVLTMTNAALGRAVRALYLEPDGTLWIGTAGHGLARWRDGAFTSFTTRQGLWSDSISQIVEDESGDLWLGCSRGIFRVVKRELNELTAGKITFVHPRVFGSGDGMPAEECSSGFCPAGLRTRAGLICFSTVKGLVLVNPRLLETNIAPPRVLIEEVSVDGRPASSEELKDGRLSISSGVGELQVHYTAFSLAPPEKIRFRRRLEHWDREWIEAGEGRVASYHRLPPGNYELRVTACNADGVWSGDEARLAVSVVPRLWETDWFRLAGAAAGFGLLVGVIRLIERRRYRARLAAVRMQHAVEKERLRISQDMHDDLGSILTQVSQLSDLGQSEANGKEVVKTQFERIGSQARAAVQSLDEIVWATNPKNDNLPRFAEYICRFADELFQSSPVRCWQEVPTDLPNLSLAADIRHNVFLAIKEAFNNVLKHSNATEVWLRLRHKDAEIRICIEDNGKGFNPENADPSRNGLQNMFHRMDECGGRVQLKSKPSGGSVVWFIFPCPISAENAKN